MRDFDGFGDFGLGDSGFGDSGFGDFGFGGSGFGLGDFRFGNSCFGESCLREPCSRESSLGVWESLESLWESCICENLVWEIFVIFLVTFLIPDSGFGSQLESSMVPHQACAVVFDLFVLGFSASFCLGSL